MTQSASGFQKSKKIGRNALFQSVGTLTSRVFGLLRDIAMAAYFPRPVTDAWAAAFRFFHVYRRIISEGALQQNLTPILAKKDQEGQLDRSFVFGLFFKTTVLLSVLSLLFYVYAPQILAAVLPALNDLQAVNLKMDISHLTLGYFQIMVIFILFISLYSLSVSLLNYYGSYFIPAAAAMFFNVSMLVFVFVPEVSGFIPGWGLAAGVSVGAFVQFVVLIPQLKKLPFFNGKQSLKTAIKILNLSQLTKTIEFDRVMTSVVSVGFLQLLSLINLHFTAGLEVGTLSHFYLADRLLEFPQSLITASYCASLLPVLSQLQVNDVHYQKNLVKVLKHNFYLLGVASLGLSLFAKFIAWLLFYRGHFGDSDLNQLTLILQYYGPLIFIFGLSRILLVHLGLQMKPMKLLFINLGILFGHFLILKLQQENLLLTSLLQMNLITCGVLFMIYLYLSLSVLMGKHKRSESTH